MQCLTHLLTLLCATAHLATALPPAPRSTTPFQIDGFVAQGYPEAMDGDKHLSFVEFNITIRPDEGNAWCWAWADVTDLSIGDIATVNCQADQTVMWSFVKTSDGTFNFNASWQYTGHGKLVGSYVVPESQVQWVTDADGQAVQNYVGPSSFSITTEDVFGTS